MARVTYVEDPAAMRAFLGWDGPAGVDFTRRMNTLVTRQLQDAPRRSGRMAAEINTRRMQSDPGKFLEGAVGVNPGGRGQSGYANYVTSGTRPHVILPKRGKALKFMIAGKAVFARRVNHPGTRPNPYLTRHLNEFVR